MKKLLSTITLLLLISSIALAQNNDKGEPSYNLCIKSDPGSRPGFLLINTSTGEFRFEDCTSGFVLVGSGKYSVSNGVQRFVFKGVAAPKYVLQATKDKNGANVTLQRDSALLFAFNDGEEKGNSCVCIR